MDVRSVLSPALVEVCQTLAASGLIGSYYLAGGTGLALQLGHRKSEDLDFFSIEPGGLICVEGISSEIDRSFKKSEAVLETRAVDQLVWSLKGVKVSFISYPFPLLHPLKVGGDILTELQQVKLACPREIAAMKAYSLGRRAVARDYVDLYFILLSHQVTLKDIVMDASRKFVLSGEPLFSQRLFLEQLCYMADLEDVDATLRMVKEPGPTLAEVEAVLRQEVRRYLSEAT